MSLRINTNVNSLNIQRHLEATSKLLAGNMRRLSTGLRIASAADDAAGLAISERLRAQIRSLDQAKRNSHDGISLAQTAEGALDEVSNILVRMRELSIQAANGTTSAADKDTLQEEFGQLRAEVDRISSSTEFNGINLLDGSSSTVSLQVGAGVNPAANQISVQLQSTLSTSLSIDSLDIGAGGDTSAAITSIDAAINSVSSIRGRLGAVQNRLASTINNLSVQSENLAAANSRIRDVDFAYETSLMTRNQFLQQASISLLGQANAMPLAALDLLA
jgi:flagellin